MIIIKFIKIMVKMVVIIIIMITIMNYNETTLSDKKIAMMAFMI